MMFSRTNEIESRRGRRGRAMTATPAKRGDLAIIESRHTYYVIGQGTTVHNEFTVCEVTSIKRDGSVRAVRSVNLGESTIDLARWTGYQRIYLVSKARINVADALAAARRNTWPGHSDHPKCYDTLNEVKEALRPHLIGS